jgi:hypothetical protein
MGGHVGSSWSLAIAACQGGTTITGGWLIGDRSIVILPIGSPLTGGLTGRSTAKWLINMLPTCI